jgi:hypothetical protein
MTINIMPLWRYQAMEVEFNRRQISGESCADLVRFMVMEILPIRRGSCNLYWFGPYSVRK